MVNISSEFIMRDFKKDMIELSQREISRKQFLALAGSGFLGMIGLFRLLQIVNTPSNADLAASDRGVFGEREYGHSSDRKQSQAESKNFNEDAFG